MIWCNGWRIACEMISVIYYFFLKREMIDGICCPGEFDKGELQIKKNIRG
jgi:hypothetical protein